VAGDPLRGPVRRQFFEYLAANWRGFTLYRAAAVPHCVRHGVPDPLRGAVWQHMVASKERQLRFPGLYATLHAFPSGTERQIRRDLHRTFPHDPLFKDRDGGGQRALFRVLNAHSNFDARTGYMQGMAFVVGFLLRYVDEETAFWMFVAMMQDAAYRLRLMYGPGVGGFLLLIHQIDQLVARFLPSLAAHLAAADFTAAVYAPPFIPSLFLGRVPRDVGVRILDVFLCEGTPTLARLFLGLLRYAEPDLLRRPAEDALTILTAACDAPDVRRWFHCAFDRPVPTELLDALEREYWERVPPEKPAPPPPPAPPSPLTPSSSSSSWMDPST